MLSTSHWIVNHQFMNLLKSKKGEIIHFFCLKWCIEKEKRREGICLNIVLDALFFDRIYYFIDRIVPL
jgi:hypothetical protein